MPNFVNALGAWGSDAFATALQREVEALPPGVQLRTAFDQSIYVKRSISETIDTLFLAFGLVVIIIFLFLRNLRATIIPGLAIPVSIIGAFGVMYFLGFSINTFTLLALILAIGLVVDDAIIVLENAYRHQEELGETPENAAMRGTSEIGFAVIATTVSLVAVFAPLAFLQGSRPFATLRAAGIPGLVSGATVGVDVPVASAAGWVVPGRALLEGEALHLDTTDGLSFTFDSWRVNVRMSNTELVLRVNVETRGDRALLDAMTKRVLAAVDD